MNQPPPLRACSIFNGKKVLLIDIDPHQRARDVDAADNIQAARSIAAGPCRRLCYCWMLVGIFLVAARDLYREVKSGVCAIASSFSSEPPDVFIADLAGRFHGCRKGAPAKLAGMKSRLVTAA